MPDRIIRDELLESERWLRLKDNADRLAYVALLLRADNLGNFSAQPFRLLRLWRDFGIHTEPLVAKTLLELVNHDLVRLYEADGNPFLHIPRFGQRLRYLSRVFPLSPWTTPEQKQKVANNSPGDSQALTGRSPAEVKRSEEKKKDLDLLISKKEPVDKKVKTVIKNPPSTPKAMADDSGAVAKNRKIAQAMAAGDRDLAKRIRDVK